jgi:hypothetical protein
MILPCNRIGRFGRDHQLGWNLETSGPRRLGAHEYRDYRKADGKWPLRFACYVCGDQNRHDSPEKERLEDDDSKRRLAVEIGNTFIWPIVVMDLDPRYNTKEIYYTVAAPEQEQFLPAFITERVKIVGKVEILAPIAYDQKFDFPEFEP